MMCPSDFELNIKQLVMLDMRLLLTQYNLINLILHKNSFLFIYTCSIKWQPQIYLICEILLQPKVVGKVKLKQSSFKESHECSAAAFMHFIQFVFISQIFPVNSPVETLLFIISARFCILNKCPKRLKPVQVIYSLLTPEVIFATVFVTTRINNFELTCERVIPPHFESVYTYIIGNCAKTPLQSISLLQNYLILTQNINSNVSIFRWI
ncbi:Hypothetical_protein [Hexamita inflata]|uniref:Hypothetical_protein n=1 Tax=Hexamita inflata TaxID=28002 RepID=A0AA86R224_9EUKA|nr:Hypothetical protein HINF_LOCUS53201 [Hexamita inflata]